MINCVDISNSNIHMKETDIFDNFITTTYFIMKYIIIQSREENIG